LEEVGELKEKGERGWLRKLCLLQPFQTYFQWFDGIKGISESDPILYTIQFRNWEDIFITAILIGLAKTP